MVIQAHIAQQRPANRQPSIPATPLDWPLILVNRGIAVVQLQLLGVRATDLD